MVDETGRGLDNGPMNLLRTLARPLLAAPFLFDGISALLNPSDHVDRACLAFPVLKDIAPEVRIEEAELHTLTRVLGASSIAASIAFATNRAPRTFAACLAGIGLPIACINAPVWTASDRQERTLLTRELTRRLALVAALALASTDRVGEPSLVWKRANWKKQRALIAAVRENERRRYAPTDTPR